MQVGKYGNEAELEVFMEVIIDALQGNIIKKILSDIFVFFYKKDIFVL